MNVSEARKLFVYTEWANARMMATLRAMSADQLDRTIPSSFPTIRETIAHIFSAEWIWLRRWRGDSPTAPPAWDEGADLDVLVSAYDDVCRDRGVLLDSLSDADLDGEISYRSMKGDPFTQPLGELMRHVVNHSSYHRGQLTTMIRQAGATPPATDYIFFLREG